ncbi:hypothetical protein DCAR_0101781 [Daucus carota subsp. sativus]|uniref:BHLH domain-containing protein n=1 Tax=Daucus carota subsp. sativus TaxID=79200 RepID=A0AAF0W5P4_DAUCS|nr:hypothetical protein DCAR_0101781 [Daucus carota subsp. sativus]
MDKASVLGDVIKYLKQLQERVKALEEQTRRNIDNHAAGIPVEGPLPEIEVRIPYKDILIKIHCEKRKGVLKEKPC